MPGWTLKVAHVPKGAHLEVVCVMCVTALLLAMGWHTREGGSSVCVDHRHGCRSMVLNSVDYGADAVDAAV